MEITLPVCLQVFFGMFLEMFGIVEHTDREKQAPHLHLNQLRNKLKKT